MVPTSCPPIDCHIFCPSLISCPVKRTMPSVVTTCAGIGGAFRYISLPKYPSTENEITMTAIKAIQSFFVVIRNGLVIVLV
jgi:hypothetical protein